MSHTLTNSLSTTAGFRPSAVVYHHSWTFSSVVPTWVKKARTTQTTSLKYENMFPSGAHTHALTHPTKHFAFDKETPVERMVEIEINIIFGMKSGTRISNVL